MSKIDFSGAEKNLDRNFRKMFIQKLIRMKEKKQRAEDEEKKKAKSNKNMTKIIHSLQKDLDRMSEKSEKMWEELGITKEEIANFIENPGRLSRDEWDAIKALMSKVKEYKKDIGSTLEQEINDDIVNMERNRHEDKRININEKWKPV